MKSGTISSEGCITIPKEVRSTLHIKEGDQLIFQVKEGKIILDQVVSVPRSQAWFWSKEVQEKLKKSEKNYQSGTYKRYKNIDKLIENLNNER